MPQDRVDRFLENKAVQELPFERVPYCKDVVISSACEISSIEGEYDTVDGIAMTTLEDMSLDERGAKEGKLRHGGDKEETTANGSNPVN